MWILKALVILDKWSETLIKLLNDNQEAQAAWFRIVQRFSAFHANSANAARIYNEQLEETKKEAARRINS